MRPASAATTAFSEHGIRPGGAQFAGESNAERVAIDRRTPIEALPEFLSPAEFRAYVGIGRSAVYDLIRRHEIPYRKFGRTIRIPKSVLTDGRAEVE